MSAILKVSIKAIVLCGLLSAIASNSLLAQCNTTKKKLTGGVKIETTDNYQYTRTDGDYVGVLIHPILLKKPTGNTYYLAIKYTGTTAMAHVLHLNLKFEDSTSVTSNLRLIKVQKTDNIKLSTKVFEASLNGPDLLSLQQKPLKEITVFFTDKAQTVSVPVNDATFMQTQLACLQQQVK